MKHSKAEALEAELLVDNIRILLILFCWYPHLWICFRTANIEQVETNLLESSKTCKNRTTYPRRVFTLRRGVNLDLNILQSQLFDFVEKTVAETFKMLSVRVSCLLKLTDLCITCCLHWAQYSKRDSSADLNQLDWWNLQQPDEHRRIPVQWALD